MQRIHLGRESPVQHHGAVVVVPEGKAATLVLGVSPLGLLGALGPTMQADELLHMLRRAVQSDVQEVGLVPGGGDMTLSREETAELDGSPTRSPRRDSPAATQPPV